MTNTTLAPLNPPNDEQRLHEFGLSSELIHSGMRPGLARATNRTSLALSSAAGTDIYHDGMEQLYSLLIEHDWRRVYVDQQPRFLHPDGIMSFTISSGIDVANPDHRRKPRTPRKGKSTRKSLDPRGAEVIPLFRIPEIEREESDNTNSESAPLWLLLYEITEQGLNLELSRPANMTQSGIVTDWSDRIIIENLDIDSNFAEFEQYSDYDINVDVEPI